MSVDCYHQQVIFGKRIIDFEIKSKSLKVVSVCLKQYQKSLRKMDKNYQVKTQKNSFGQKLHDFTVLKN